jgi:hypothetical protein
MIIFETDVYAKKNYWLASHIWMLNNMWEAEVMDLV